MELTIKQALQQAVAAHKGGSLQEAERIYRAILKDHPKHPDANHNLGVLAVSVNQTESALPFLKTALDINPNVEQFWLSYIDALVKARRLKDAKQAVKKAKKRGFGAKKLQALLSQPQSLNDHKGPSESQLNSLMDHYQNGRFDDAEKLATMLTQEFPSHQFAWKVAGAILGATGRQSEALKANQTAIALHAEDADAHYNLGITLQAMGKLNEAEASYNQAIALKPGYAEAYNNLGNTLIAQGKFGEAEACLTQAIALNPDYAEAINNLGNSLQSQGKYKEAEVSYNQAIALNPGYIEAYNNLGNTLRPLARFSEAEANLRHAIALKPDYIEAHKNLGSTLKALGRIKEAEASFYQAITLKPDSAEAHRQLTLIKRFETQDEHYLKMLDLYRDKSISDEQRCHINFGIAKACEDLGNFEQAFIHYREGNELRKKLLNYDINQDVKLFKQIKSNYPQIKQSSLKPDKSSKNPTPIFIIGMPRSGTTLVEQIISSHPQVTGAGELPYTEVFGAGIATGFPCATVKTMHAFRHKYLENLMLHCEGKPVVTDKAPLNFRFAGLLATAFPEAKFVHVKRDAAAVCWANYKTYFASTNLGFCYGLGDVVRYHGLYENLMEFWARKLKGRIYNLDYEILTNDQEHETLKLIDYIELDWDEHCLSPQNNARAVATASSLQVRRKVYQGSSEQWKKYKPFLGNAFDDLTSYD